MTSRTPHKEQDWNPRREDKAAQRDPSPIRPGKGAPKGAAVTSRGIEIEQPDGEGNAYAEAIEAGHGSDSRWRTVFIICIVLVALYFVGLVFPKNILNEGLFTSGQNTGYNFSWFVASLIDNANGLAAVFSGQGGGTGGFLSTMILYVVVAFCGAGMALCGALYQGTFKNALVTPSTLGVMSGAIFGMTMWVLLFVDDDGSNVAWLSSYAASNEQDVLLALWQQYGLALCSFLGCILVVGLVLLTLRLVGLGTRSPLTLIITGQLLGGVIGIVTNSARYYYVETAPDGIKAELLSTIQISSFYRTFQVIDVIAVAVPVIICFIIIMRLRSRLDILTLADEEARAMGVDARRLRALIIALCTLVTAILVSFCGHVGFVGFLVPHMARRLVGPNNRFLLPASTALGAVFVLAAYLLVSITLGPDYETMTGMFISIAGAAVFLVTAIAGKGGARGTFQ